MTTATDDPADALLDRGALRREGLARRDGLAPAQRAQASAAICARLLSLPELSGAAVVAAYWPIRSEVDPRPAFAALAARGVALALPTVEDESLVFRAWREGEPLAPARFGLSAPSPTAARLRPDRLLVPLARFDRACHRLGYGKGHYDRALAALATHGPVVAIGLAFSVQETARVPAEPHDVALDVVVTERETIRAREAGG